MTYIPINPTLEYSPLVPVTNRALDTVYQNTSSRSKLIMVAVNLKSGVVASSVSASIFIAATSMLIDPINVVQIGFPPSLANEENQMQLSAIIPPKYFYQVGTGAGGTGVVSLILWAEAYI